MAEKIAKVGVKREKDWLYNVSKTGDIQRAGTKQGPFAGMKQVVARVGVKKEPGFLYFVDKQGDISRAKMARGRKKKE